MNYNIRLLVSMLYKLYYGISFSFIIWYINQMNMSFYNVNEFFSCNVRQKMKIHIKSLGISCFNGLRMHIRHIVQYCIIMISSTTHVLSIVLWKLCTSNINRKLWAEVNVITWLCCIENILLKSFVVLIIKI